MVFSWFRALCRHLHFQTENSVSQCFIKKAIFVLFKVALIERLSKLSVCVLSSKYLSNVKVMHVFKCIFILRYLINIIIIFFPLVLYCLLYCSVCVVQGIKKKTQKKYPLIQVSHYAFSNSK